MTVSIVPGIMGVLHETRAPHRACEASYPTGRRGRDVGVFGLR
jgi:hypothetical protein